MSKKKDLLFVESKYFGKLYYHNVYSFYDEPLIFTALNEFGQFYFCYGLGTDEDHDRWVIVPISVENTNKIEQKDIPIVKAIQQKHDTDVLVVKICLESGNITEKHSKARALPFLLPNETVFIRENINYDGKRKHTHKIRISKKNNNPITSELLNKASDAFGDFCRNYLRKFDLSTRFYPKDAITGSFIFRIKADSLDEKGHEVLAKIANKKDFLNALDRKEIDLRVVIKLFNVLAENNLEIQLIDEDSTEVIIGLGADYVEGLLSEVNDRLGVYLDSTMVPQADNLDTLKRYLGLMDKDGVVTADSLKVDKRQVSYYKDACTLLSLLHSYSKLTPLGEKALNSETDAGFVKIIQRQFEESECGHLWMLNQNVRNIVEIDESSAVDFLVNNCNGLSDKTSHRRAQTLKSWVKKFKLHA